MVQPQKNTKSVKGPENGLKSKIPVIGKFYWLVLLLLTACAIQRAPMGGPRDEEPPRLDTLMPPNETINFDGEEIQIGFNEFIQLKDHFKEITISPEPESRPEILVKRRNIVIKFTDTLQKNTTYSINFGKSIADLNEGNPFPNFKYVFSTGDIIDSLRISGTVRSYIPLDGRGQSGQKKKEEEDLIVLLHPAGNDSLIVQKRPAYYTFADTAGRFELSNLKEGTYRLYALKDVNGSRVYDDPQELLAFRDQPIRLKKDTSGIRLTMARIEEQETEILEEKALDEKISLLLNKKPENIGSEIIFPENFRGKEQIELGKQNDSVFLWLPSPTYDSVRVAISEGETVTDTLLFRNFRPKKEIPPHGITDDLTGKLLKPGKHPVLTFSRPVTDPDIAAFTVLEDSVALNPSRFKLVKVDLRRYRLEFPWKTGRSYQVSIADSTIRDIYNTPNRAYKREFTGDSRDNYGNIIIEYKIADTTGNKQYIVELLNESNRKVRSDILTESKKIAYRTLEPGKYTIQVIYDRNKNGKWDGGYLFEKTQPERISLYPLTRPLRSNWDENNSITIQPER